MKDTQFSPAIDVRESMRRRPGRPGKIEKAKNPRGALTRLATYLLPHGAKLALVAVLIVSYSILGLCGPYLMGRGIDGFIARRDIPGLGRIVLLMLGAYLASNAFQVAANWLMAKVSQTALRTLRAELFDRLQRLPMAFFDTHASGALMSRLTNDIEAVNQAVSQNISSLLASVVSMTGILIAMFALNPYLAAASLVVVPLLFGFTRFIAHFTRQGFKRLQKELGELNAVTEEAISGQRVILAFRRGDAVTQEFKRRSAGVYEAGVKANSYAMLLMPLTAVLGNFFVVVLAGFGGFLALSGLVSVGIIATFISYGQNFISPLRQLANLFNSLQAALAGAERVFEVLDLQDELPLRDARAAADSGRAMGPIRGAVSFQDVGFSYVEGTEVIRDFNLTVSAGQTVALVGPTGAGKTTIINLLSRFYEVGAGSIRIDGVDIRDYPIEKLRGSLGTVLQDTFLFADTVMENIRYGRLEATDEECVRAATLAEADHFIRQLPDGYATVLSERASNLSQGQRQLLSIARAILADPAILILDEATSSVDTRTELRIQRALLRLMEGKTSFVIAHRLSTIREADLVVVIDGGTIVERGTHDELMATGGTYRRLYESQFKGQAI